MSLGPPEVILAADLGAGSIRAAAIGFDGRTHAIARRALAIDEPAPGWAEADPDVWWQALCQTMSQVLAGVTPRAIAITAMTRSQVFLDRAGRSLRPAIIWRDTRAAAEAAACARWLPIENPATAVNPFHTLARVAWLHHHEPATFDALGAVLEPKDALNLRLTGVTAADGVTAARFDDLAPAAGAPAWLSDSLSRLALPRRMPWQAVGTVTATEAPFDGLRGLPVFGGAMDTWAGAVGAGAVAPGLAYDVAGTSEAVGLITAGGARVNGLVPLPWTETAFQLGGPTQAGGDAARWAFELLRLSGALSDAVERAGRIPPTRHLPVFLPYLAGERAPVWRTDVGGQLSGLTRAHGPAEVMFAVLEGVAGAVDDIVRTAEAAGTTAEAVHICGGGARSDAWCQLKADVLGLPVVRPREVETGLVGSAAAAAVGLGVYASLAEAVAAMNGPERTFLPRPEHADAFAERRAARKALKAFALAHPLGP
ncbi:FGGY-family carbohydrate kinase [Acuticoccus sp. I52.16.1]|uniref:xylulokinase n=1 Tax=Acuticoccus sp. I52.16.1 TaxID=2928472 RepID=UPI001FD38327|nr:FGGY-family carbohydrate kinase [Acuticoccus sp. I52.16.1]UOM35627.1 FGGY-family carbohydrate kinase [Acuticoccus sp. I52.16.1]